MALRRKPPTAQQLSSVPPPEHHLTFQSQSQSLSLPSVSPSSSPITTATETQVLTFLKNHLNLPISPQNLLHFLQKKLHHHPRFSHLDFHIFQWASSSLPSYRHTHFTYEWMARTLAISDRFNLLTHLLLNCIPSNPCPCSDGIFSCPRVEPIYRFAINSYFRARRLDEALSAFDSMRRLIDGRPDVGLYNVVIHGLVKNREIGKALEIYDRMVKDRVTPDLFTYNILISGHCRNLNFDLALKVFEEMRSKGCEPNVISFNTLISGYVREKRFDDAVKVAYEMIEVGCSFSTVTCDILVERLCIESKVAIACDLLVDFGRKGALPAGFDCSSLVERLCQGGGGGVGRALEIAEEMWEKGNAPNLVAFTCLIDGLRKIGYVENAIRLAEKMLKEDIVMDSVSFNCLLQDACNVGRAEEADRLRMLASSKDMCLDGVTYRILIEGYAREGNRKKGEKLIDEMLDAGYIPNIATYNRLMESIQLEKREPAG